MTVSGEAEWPEVADAVIEASLWTMDRLLPATRRMIGLPLWPMLTMRNLRKRRNSRQVEVAETPGPKWESGGHTGSFLPYGLSLIRSG